MSSYLNVREVFEGFIGQRLLDVSQHDIDETEPFLFLMFENGLSIKISLLDGDSIDPVDYDS